MKGCAFPPPRKKHSFHLSKPQVLADQMPRKHRRAEIETGSKSTKCQPCCLHELTPTLETANPLSCKQPSLHTDRQDGKVHNATRWRQKAYLLIFFF